jgi:hypothetical protein
VKESELKARLSRYNQIKISVIGREVREHGLNPSLVRLGGRQTLPPARAGHRHAVVQERAPEPANLEISASAAKSYGDGVTSRRRAATCRPHP